MSKKLQFVWIDDEGKRKRASDNLEVQMSVKCEFINVSKENNYLEDIDRVNPDLILMDHNLTYTLGEYKKGSTISAIIREKHPTLPIACISGQNKKDMDSQQRMIYQTVFKITDIKKHYSAMRSIATSYRKMKSSKPSSIEDVFSLMKVPKDDIEKLSIIMPAEIKENFKDLGLYGHITHWIIDVLFERPGFLYNKLWAATFLGLSEKGFSKVEKLFESAKYKGIFSDESNERWWKSKLLDILNSKVHGYDLPWEKGRFLAEFQNSDFSKDFYTDYKEDYPETVAYTDESTNEWQPMKLKYTISHPKFEKLLFFDEIRMMKP